MTSGCTHEFRTLGKEEKRERRGGEGEEAEREKRGRVRRGGEREEEEREKRRRGRIERGEKEG